MKLSLVLSRILCPILWIFWPIYTINPFHCVHTQYLRWQYKIQSYYFVSYGHLRTTDVIKICTKINSRTRNRWVEVQHNKRQVKNGKWSTLRSLHRIHSFFFKSYITITTLFRNSFIFLAVFKGVQTSINWTSNFKL